MMIERVRRLRHLLAGPRSRPRSSSRPISRVRRGSHESSGTVWSSANRRRSPWGWGPVLPI